MRDVTMKHGGKNYIVFYMVYYLKVFYTRANCFVVIFFFFFFAMKFSKGVNIPRNCSF